MNNNFHRFRKFRQFSDLFSQIKLNYRQMSSFSGICREIRTKFHQEVSEKKAKFVTQNEKIGNSLFNREKMLTIFGWNFKIWAVQKYVNLVDLVKSFPTSIYLQKSVSIQPRTSLSKFGGKFNSLFIRLLRCSARIRPGGRHASDGSNVGPGRCCGGCSIGAGGRDGAGREPPALQRPLSERR